MAKDLTTSAHDRQNILNNSYALRQAEKHLALGGVEFNGERLFTKSQLMEIFGISDATVERYIANHSNELKSNGYRLIKGRELKEFKGLEHVSFINEGNKAPTIGVFNYRAVLNFAMLLVESEQAKIIRTRLLDIVIDTLAERAGGHTKYINQRDENYLLASFQEESYRKQFTDALDECVEGNNWKYARFTNLVYQSIFHEDAAEYRKVLNLAQKRKSGTQCTPKF